MKSVTKEEFYEFLKNYPNKLESHVIKIIEPPIMSYHDFTLGKYPKSLVASHFLNDYLENKGDHEYKIKEEEK